MPPRRDADSPAPALERGLAILELLVRTGKPLAFSSIASGLALPTASAARILKVLQAHGYVAQDVGGGPYRLGPAIWTLAGLAPSRQRLCENAGPVLRSLRKLTGNTALLIHWNGQTLECLAKEMDEHSIAMQAVGEIRTNLLGYPWSPCVYEDLAARPRRLRTVVGGDRAAISRMKAALGKARRAGYAYVGERALRRFAAPVRGVGGRLLGAIGLGGTPATIPDGRIEEFGSAVAAHAARLSSSMGAEPA
jgi:DNA-binding IclR family transcriptional regulator